jgi:hypothetical protein
MAIAVPLLLLLLPMLPASSLHVTSPATLLMINVKNRQEKTTGQKTLLDLKYQEQTGGCLLADS